MTTKVLPIQAHRLPTKAPAMAHHHRATNAVNMTSTDNSTCRPMHLQTVLRDEASYPRSMTVSPESQQQYAAQHGYVSNSQYYNSAYPPSSQSPIVASQTPQFIPTPSDYSRVLAELGLSTDIFVISSTPAIVFPIQQQSLTQPQRATLTYINQLTHRRAISMRDLRKDLLEITR
ncbi:hypothetical protein ONZ45_g1523 [Pleurotus djamor]|nr:hypothetical protein ONZ45_g1523 [Pleurotus djamor]